MSEKEKTGKISLAEVEHVARLARLSIKPDDKPRFAEQLSRILDYIEKLNQLDTEAIPPTAHILALGNVFRQDQTQGSLPEGKSLANAPEKEGRFFKVPRVIE